MSDSNHLLSLVQELTWMLMDDRLEPSQLDMLEQLLKENATARQTYLECVQLHVDLKEHFGSLPQIKLPGQAQVPAGKTKALPLAPLALPPELGQTSGV